MAKVVVDAGHGGSDPGAVYEGRQEKDDNLRLALAVGELLSQNGVDVLYTRTDDVYDSPYRKAMIANESGADYLISFHRNASPIAGNASGIETLVYADRGVAAQMARDINRELAALGFRDIGVIERPGLAVLRRSRMPAVLIETGFIDNDADNLKFDEEFEEIEYWKHLKMKVSYLIQSHQHLILLKSPTTLKMNGRLLLYLTIHLPPNFTVFKSVHLKTEIMPTN